MQTSSLTSPAAHRSAAPAAPPCAPAGQRGGKQESASEREGKKKVASGCSLVMDGGSCELVAQLQHGFHSSQASTTVTYERTPLD